MTRTATLVVLALPLALACPDKKTPEPARAAAPPPVDAELVTPERPPSPEEQRLAMKVAALEKLRGEMQAVLDLLPRSAPPPARCSARSTSSSAASIRSSSSVC